eukprot:NODE_10110_length_1376_cov_3.614091.p1 GENE.NODE_10110_length_1376_cov_3.614091~~NODE_10110_length_1376_cov_3.614091.p1  ORF type:complete len:328 (-),score=50.81 NODE_10110_length_1376_cov_3.614091:391-1296(-)
MGAAQATVGADLLRHSGTGPPDLAPAAFAASAGCRSAGVGRGGTAAAIGAAAASSGSGGRLGIAGSFGAPKAAQTLSCESTGDDVRFHGPIARVFCPPHCEKEPESVALGATVHPMRSAVCNALVADGVAPEWGGEMLLTRVRGLESYRGVDSGGVATLATTGLNGDGFHAYPIDTVDTRSCAPLPSRLLCCEDTFASLGLKPLGSSVVVECPAGCLRGGALSGTSVYTPGSSVCAAAEHASVLGKVGGKAVVTRGHGQDVYFGTQTLGGKSSDATGTQDGYTVALPIPDVIARTATAQFL